MRFTASIIIPSYNFSAVTINCIEKIFKYTRGVGFEVIVVDDGSKDKIINTNQKVKIIMNKKNLGFAKAANKGAKVAKGKYLVFLNNDVLVTNNWLTILIKFLEENPHVGACQPKLRSNIQKKYFDYAGGAGGQLDFLGYPFTRGRIFDAIEIDRGQYDTPFEIVWATGACLVVKRSVFRQAHGFDEYFHSYAEEVDLCLRMQNLGWSIWCVPQSVVYHYGAYTSNKNLSQKIYYIHRNHLYLVLKHYSIWPYLPLIVLRFFLDALSIFYYLHASRTGFVLSLARAHLNILADLPMLASSGVLTLSGRGLIRHKNIYRGSVVADHFLFGRRSFDWKKRRYKNYTQVTYL